MQLIANNVNEAFSEIFWLIKAHDLEPQPTRNGPALVLPEPFMTCYLRPQERVLFSPERDANPIFHLMESIWMLAGRRDVAFLEQFNRRIGQYADGDTFNAAYGYRWRHHFGSDQLLDVIQTLRDDPTSRQAVVQMWDAADLTKTTRDKACNTQIVFEVRAGALNMSVFNRSNDIWWGAYGANAVHFSVLMEFVAAAVGVPMGRYYQISTNFHLYTELYSAVDLLRNPPVRCDLYAARGSEGVTPRPLLDSEHTWEEFLEDCEVFCCHPCSTLPAYRHSFFHKVAVPMALAARAYRNRTGDAADFAQLIEASDWRRATLDWLGRRKGVE